MAVNELVSNKGLEQTEGFVVLDLPTFKTSAKEFAERHGVEYVVAQNTLKFLVAKGIAKELEPLKIAGKKGKPTNIYEVPTEVELKAA